MKIKTTLDEVKKGLQLISERGGEVQVRGTAGIVSISGVEARFSFDINTDILTVIIVDKPLLASEAMIENKIKEFFGD